MNHLLPELWKPGAGTEQQQHKKPSQVQNRAV